VNQPETLSLDTAAEMFGLTRAGLEIVLRRKGEDWCFWAVRDGYLTGDQILRLLKAGWNVNPTWSASRI